MQFSSGRRTVVYNRMRPVAERRALAPIVGHIDRALAHEHTTRTLENQWSSPASRQIHPDRLPALDNQVDQVLTGMRDIVRGQASGLAADHPTVAIVDTFLAEIFPHGVKPITTLPFVDQVLAMETIVARLQNGMATTAARLGLAERVTHLAELVAEYRRLVDAGRGDVDYQEVRAARARGQLYLRELIALILGTFHDSDVAGHVEAREELLAPITEQLDRLHARARARRRGTPEAETADADEADADETLDEADDPTNDLPAGLADRLAVELAAERAADLADGIAGNAGEPPPVAARAVAAPG